MRFLISLILVFFFLLPQSTFAATNQFITVVNPIRGDDFFQLKNQKPVDNIKKQWQVISENHLSTTWLIRPDAMENIDVVGLLKTFPSSQEIGLFMEITPTWAKKAGVSYHQNQNWHDSGSVFLTGYSTSERQKLIDSAFTDFKNIFGVYPKSVGAWWIDAGSLNYMREKYAVVTSMDVADQYTTDNYQVWGQYFSTPFYPSKRNALIPAKGEDQKIGVVTIQWAGRDPFNSFGNGVLDSTYSVQANDYANKKYHSLTTDYFKKLLSIYLDNPYSDFGQVTIGMENDFSWDEYGAEYINQIKEVASRKSKGVKVLTMSDFGSDYQKLFPDISPTHIIFAPDPLNSGGKVLWYQTPNYRTGWFANSDGSVIRDLRLYQALDEPCLIKACPNLNLAMIETEHLDEVTFGDRWVIDEGKITNVTVKKIINGVEINYTNQSGNNRKITFLPNDVKIDNTSLPISVAISQAITSGKNVVKIEGKFNYELANGLGTVLAEQFKNIILFFVFAVIFFYLPGLAILKKTNLSNGEKYILSWPVGIVTFTFLAFILGHLHFYWGIFILPIVSLLLIRKNFIKPPIREFSLLTKLIILFGSLSWLLTTVKNGLLYDYGLGFWGAHGHDSLVHLSLIESAKRGLPLENFSFAGNPLVNYHYFYDLLLGATSILTGLKAIDLYFRAFPLLISISLGLVCFSLAKNWFKSEKVGNLSLFFLYFGGSFGWLVSYFKDRTLGGETLFWAQQGISTFINPPLAISFLIFLAGLILFSKIVSQKSYQITLIIPLVILWSSLIEFKAYGGILVLGALVLTSIVEVLRGNFSFLKISIPVVLLSVAIFLPNNLSSSGFLVFQPFWLIHSMVDSIDRLNWVRLSNARILGFESGNYFKFFTSEVIGFLIFVFGNLGTRIIGLFSILKIESRLKPFVYSFLILSMGFPILFIQKGSGFNIVQFFYYFLLIFNFLAAASLIKISNKKFGKILVLLIILLTIPTTWDSLHHYLPNRPPAMIPKGEVEGLNFLKSQPDGVVLSYFFDIKNHEKFAAPQPLFAYQSTSYVSAFSGKSEFIADTLNLNNSGVDYKGRYQIQKDIFAMKEPEVIKKELRENNITYIYAPIQSNFSPNIEILGIKKIFENSDVNIFKAE